MGLRAEPRRVIAVLGGNAFARPGEPLTMAGQFRFARDALRTLAPFFPQHVELLLSHGNGPQVGHMLVRVEESLGKAYALPLSVCVAESEGELGYVISQSLHNLLAELGTPRPIVTMLTQVEVARDDVAFDRPTKPIGPFYDRAQADAMRERGFAMIDDSGRGFRRVVASPAPRAVLDTNVMRGLLAMGAVLIAAGGGGVPVVRGSDGQIAGVDAVIDKDLTAALLGDVLDADLLVILTSVPCAYLDFGKPTQRPLGEISAAEAQRHLNDGHFAPGSMGPKVEASIAFASKPGRRAIICDPPSLAAALAGAAGTTVMHST